MGRCAHSMPARYWACLIVRLPTVLDAIVAQSGHWAALHTANAPAAAAAAGWCLQGAETNLQNAQPLLIQARVAEFGAVYEVVARLEVTPFRNSQVGVGRLWPTLAPRGS
jgi:hypothetical protein